MQLTMKDSGDLRAAARALRSHANGKAIRRELTKAIRAEVQPVVARVKTAYRAAPSQGHATSSRTRRQQPPLRASLARATRAEVRLSGRDAGVRLRVDGRKMPAGMGRLPGLYEGERRPWKSPVFGNRNVFVTRRARPTFYPVVRPRAAEVGRRIERVADDIGNRIARG